METNTPYEAIGGEQTLQRLVDAFYPKVFRDLLLAPLFDGDMETIQQKQKMFLTQFLGGPTLYSDEYGHPMMRARHMKFRITPKHAEAWLSCMREAMDEIGLEGHAREFFYSRLVQTAYHMVNHAEDNGEEPGDES